MKKIDICIDKMEDIINIHVPTHNKLPFPEVDEKEILLLSLIDIELN